MRFYYIKSLILTMIVYIFLFKLHSGFALKNLACKNWCGHAFVLITQRRINPKYKKPQS